MCPYSAKFPHDLSSNKRFVFQNSRSLICSICDFVSTETEQNNRTHQRHMIRVHESHYKHFKCSQQSLISVLSQQSLMSVLHAISRHHLQLHIREIHGHLDLHKCHECPYAAEANCNAKLYECDFTSKVNYIVYIEF